MLEQPRQLKGIGDSFLVKATQNINCVWLEAKG